ncbi:(2Fe-2S)-binding protein [Streptomyces sp. WAC06614]|uniref:(2Fe-2S)-binding protein n=1 Tax=Streptomyces sp. WAC06614 TaxID=2487416 RepID=UPI0021AE74C1|nr:2Fe-2S iron-sulfur cluster-binding protein [Streptomyces sp. WAC06614]
MSENENVSGTGAAGFGWQPVPHGGDYDSDATAFVQLPDDVLEALGMGEPLAAPGHGYVPPPMIVPLNSAASGDPTATGTWTVPTEWPEAGPVGTAGAPGMSDAPGTSGAGAAEGGEGPGPVDPEGASTAEWQFPDAVRHSPPPAPTPLDADWSQAPATLPGGAPAPWADGSAPGLRLLGGPGVGATGRPPQRVLGGPGVGTPLDAQHHDLGTPPGDAQHPGHGMPLGAPGPGLGMPAAADIEPSHAHAHLPSQAHPTPDHDHTAAHDGTAAPAPDPYASYAVPGAAEVDTYGTYGAGLRLAPEPEPHGGTGPGHTPAEGVPLLLGGAEGTAYGTDPYASSAPTAYGSGAGHTPAHGVPFGAGAGHTPAEGVPFGAGPGNAPAEGAADAAHHPADTEPSPYADTPDHLPPTAPGAPFHHGADHGLGRGVDAGHTPAGGVPLPGPTDPGHRAAEDPSSPHPGGTYGAGIGAGPGHTPAEGVPLGDFTTADHHTPAGGVPTAPGQGETPFEGGPGAAGPGEEPLGGAGGTGHHEFQRDGVGGTGHHELPLDGVGGTGHHEIPFGSAGATGPEEGPVGEAAFGGGADGSVPDDGSAPGDGSVPGEGEASDAAAAEDEDGRTPAHGVDVDLSAEPAGGPAEGEGEAEGAVAAGGPASGAARVGGDAGASGEAYPDPAPGAHHEHPLASYVLRVNGSDRPVTGAWIGESLLYVLRERLGLAGAKDGCSQGECGACAVQVDGRLVASCLVPAATAAGSEVRTVEGLAQNGELSDVQQALCRSGAVQCGFCIPGMAMTIHDLLEGNHAPSELETRQALCGNLCRCSGYQGVLDAVREVVATRDATAEAAQPGTAATAAAGVFAAGATGPAAQPDAPDQHLHQHPHPHQFPHEYQQHHEHPHQDHAPHHDPHQPRIPHQAAPGDGGVHPHHAHGPHEHDPHGQDHGQHGGMA